MKRPEPYHVWFRNVAQSYDLQSTRHRAAGHVAAPIIESRLRTGLAEDYANGVDPDVVAADLVHGRHLVVNPQPVATC